MARYQGTARLMSNSFGSSLWMLPHSKYCKTDSMYWKYISGRSKKDHQVYYCERDEFTTNYSGWPTNVVNIEVPSSSGVVSVPLSMIWFAHFTSLFAILVGEIAYFSFVSADGNLSSTECKLPTLLSFSAHEVSNGKFFRAIKDYDPDSERALYQLKKLVVRILKSQCQLVGFCKFYNAITYKITRLMTCNPI